jgi:hypothetical protein
MGNLFSRKQSIAVINKMRFAELREWNFWHEKMANEEATIKCSNCGTKYDARKQKKCSCGKG